MLTEFVSSLSPRAASVVLGAGLGIAFGILAQRSRFCLRRGLVGNSGSERASALSVWLMALAVAVAGTGALMISGLVDFSAHRLMASRVPLFAIIAGGALFGVGTFLARGCASRLAVLAGSGNLRALTVLVVFAVVAHATLKGVLAPLRTWLGGFTVDVGAFTSLAALPGGAAVWSIGLALLLGTFAIRLRARPGLLLAGAAIGALAPIGWLGTGYLLADEFDPIPLESLALTSAASESLFWTIASSAIAPNFGLGLLGGVLAGSLVAALLAREAQLVGFSEGTPTGRYLAGGALMGVGGVLAGGCTVGAGLSGVGMLSVAAMVALASIVGGIALAHRLAQLPAITSIPTGGVAVSAGSL